MDVEILNRPAGKATIDWVVFDLGDVLVTRTQAFPRLAARLGVAESALTDSYFEGRLDYDRTSAADVYWSGVATRSGGPAPDQAAVADLVALDDTGWNVTDPDVLTLVDDLVAAGLRVAVLSNAPSSMGRLVGEQEWASRFDILVFSGDVGLVKPDPAIFRVLLKALDAEPERVTFLDDRLPNVEGAAALGIRAVHFQNAASARNDLRTLGLPV